MSSIRISRVAVSAASVFFAVLAVTIWIAPEYAARQADIEPLGRGGLATVRADFGGLFAGMSVLCAVAAWTARRQWILAAAAMLTAIVAGRLLGWITAGTIGADAGEMAIEIGAIAALAAFSGIGARCPA